MVQQPKVSVIIPVYNAEKYLRECLDSVVNQTLKDIEIICVDDGSTDDSLTILQTYAELDERIQYIQQKNQHAGVARNRGLEKAKGEYVIFLDADDFFDPNLLRVTYAQAIKTEADVILFDAQKFDAKTNEFISTVHYLKDSFLPQKQVFSGEDISDVVFDITTPAPWTKLFNRAFLQKEKLQFQSLINSNDLYFVFLALCLAERMAVVKEPLVYYRVNTGTNLQNTKTQAPLCFIQAYDELYRTLQKYDGKWEAVRKSFANAVISTATYNLETSPDEAVRIKIIEALASNDFRKTGYLNLPMEDYVYPEKFFFLQQELAEYSSKRLQHVKQTITCETKIDNEKRPLVSVIIPVYNMERWLEASVKSIREQTLENIEIICVNDGSMDDSLVMLNKYSSEDKRIKVVSQPNGGLSAARNLGLIHATGEYIYFFDSDDVLRRDALEYLHHEAKKHDLDVLLFDAETLYQSEELKNQLKQYKQYYIREKAYDEIVTGEEMYKVLRNERAYRTSVCLLFFKHDFLREANLSFLVGILHEDELFTVQALLKAKRVSHRNIPFFVRRIRENSIVSSKVSFLNCYANFRIIWELMHWIDLEKLQFSDQATGKTLENWMTWMFTKVWQMYNDLPNPQKRCVSVLPLGQRTLFQTFFVHRETGYKPQNATATNCSASVSTQFIGSEPTGIGRFFRRVGKSIIPKSMKPFIKKQLLRIPHQTKLAIKKRIHW